MADTTVVGEVHARVVDQLSAWREGEEAAGRTPTVADQRAYTATLIQAELDRYARAQVDAGQRLLDGEQERELGRTVQAMLFGLGPLEALLADPDIENIDYNGCDGGWLQYADGTTRPAPSLWPSDDALVSFVQMIGARDGHAPRRFDLAQPRLNLRLPDGSRLFAIMDVSHRPCLSIRRHRLVRVFLQHLIELGAIDAGLAEFLRALVKARKNVIIAGGTGVGKTTMLRALLNEVPPEERLVTIENAFELALHEPGLKDLHPRVVALEAREANVEGQGEIPMAELVKAGLRLNPSRVIVGEVLGDEIVSMLEAMSQGNDGSMGTIHATSSAYVWRRMAMYAAKSAMRLPAEVTYQMIDGAIDFVVFIGMRDERALGGQLRRFVSSIREVTGAEGQQVITNEVYRPGPQGRAVPVAGALRCREDLELVGFDPSWLESPAGWWDPR
jgi:pilus assembly protein CpaF